MLLLPNHLASPVLPLLLRLLPNHLLPPATAAALQRAVKQSLVAATCISSAIGCFMMCFLANMPLAIAPGMGINAYCECDSPGV